MGLVVKAKAKSAGRDAYAIADSYVPAYSKAFKTLAVEMRKLVARVPARSREDFKKFPVFNPAKPRAVEGYWKAYNAIADILTDIVIAGGEDGLAQAKIKTMRFQVAKSCEPVLVCDLGLKRHPYFRNRKTVQPLSLRRLVTKAKKPTKTNIAVPLNPYSKKWIRDKSSSLVVEVSKQQRESVRTVLASYFDQNAPIEATKEALKRTIGLHDRYADAVESRRFQMLSSGVPEERADALADKYAEQLLDSRVETIARTETKDAQSRGQADAWRIAEEEGYMPKGTKRKWVALDHSKRLSDICEELDGQTVAMDEPFFSKVLGEEIDRPPAHPNCRSTLVLVFGDD